jgi:glycosyltransferase involved in cell wall biosynthesis
MLYFKPDLLNFCITYDLEDFFYPFRVGPSKSLLNSFYYFPLKRLYKRYAARMSEKRNFFIPLSHGIERSIEALHYPHSSTVFPPCEMNFKVKTKESYVVNTSRLVPSKRLKDFIEIARKIPSYNFIIVGKMSETEEALFPRYKQSLRNSLPSNLKLIEDLVRNQKQVVESARVYLYPSIEPGVSISLGQAMGAGCIPITPRTGGGAEMVEATGTGYTYETLEEAAQIVKQALESSSPRDHPDYISKRAQIFSADSFDAKIRMIIREQYHELSSKSST